MPEYIVVCCYRCKLFQGQQQNKQKKFKCKVCGEQQSVRHIFAKSDYPKDIRSIVQELNRKRCEQNEPPSMETTPSNSELIQPTVGLEKPIQHLFEKSQWDQFLQPKSVQPSTEPEDDDPQYITDTSLLPSNHSRNRQRKNSRTSFSHKQKRNPSQPMEVVTTQPSGLKTSLSEENSVFVTDIEKTEAEPQSIPKPVSIPTQNSNSMWSRFM